MNIHDAKTNIQRLVNDKKAEIAYLNARYEKKINFYKKAVILMRNINRKKQKSHGKASNVRVRNAPEKLSRRLNSSPKNKKRKAMNYKPF
jgi:hypothetical protein